MNRAIACLVPALTFTLMLSGCARSGSAVDPKSVGQSTTSVGAPQQACPNEDGGRCLGRLDGAAHTTTVFKPTITYRAPAQWANYEDLPGNFLLVPPGADLAGVDAGSSDYIGVYSSVKASTGCFGSDTDDGSTPQDLAQWIRRQQDLVATAPRPVSLGGLQGVVLDIRLAAHPNRSCPLFDGKPVVPVIAGVGQASLDHAIIAGLTMRLYLLEHNGKALAVEVDDVQGSTSLDDLVAVVNTLTFAAD